MERAPQPQNNGKTRKSKVIQLDGGRIPPQALDLEEAVLGAMLIP